MVKDVEELGSEIQSDLLRQNEPLDQGEIGVHEVWSGKWTSIRGSKLPWSGGREATGVEEFAQALVEPAFGSASLIRAVYWNEVVFEIDPRLIHAIRHEHREAGKCSFDYRNLPISKHGVDWPAPVAPVRSPFAKRKIVDHACCKRVPHVDL